MSIVSLVIAPYIAVPNSTLANENMHHATEMLHVVCGKGDKVCSEAEMATMKKEGKTCEMTDSTNHTAGIKSCCEKPGLKDRFK
jgi:hypothetical protein